MASPLPTNGRSVVVVLGMHRAGTSLTTNMLELLGVHLGSDLIPGRSENPLGFFENSKLVEEIKSIEEILERKPFRPSGLLPFPEDWLSLEAVGESRKRLGALLNEEIEKAGDKIFGFKDPRTCRFLPLWQQVFADLDIKPLYILALRRPAAVIRSNIVRTTLTPEEANLIWMLHYADAIRHSNAQFVAVADYERWFSDPAAQAARISAAIGNTLFDADAFTRDASAIITKDFNHADDDKEDVRVHPAVASFHELLLRICDSTDAAQKCIDIARDFDSFSSLVSPWTRACDEQDALLSHLVDASRAAGRSRERELRAETRIKSLEQTIAELRQGPRPMNTPLGPETPAMAALRAELLQSTRKAILLERDNKLLLDHCRKLEAQQRDGALNGSSAPHEDGINDIRRQRAENLNKKKIGPLAPENK